jgi:hypothetical protein
MSENPFEAQTNPYAGEVPPVVAEVDPKGLRFNLTLCLILAILGIVASCMGGCGLALTELTQSGVFDGVNAPADLSTPSATVDSPEETNFSVDLDDPSAEVLEPSFEMADATAITLASFQQEKDAAQDANPSPTSTDDKTTEKIAETPFKDDVSEKAEEASNQAKAEVVAAFGAESNFSLETQLEEIGRDPVVRISNVVMFLLGLVTSVVLLMGSIKGLQRKSGAPKAMCNALALAIFYKVLGIFLGILSCVISVRGMSDLEEGVALPVEAVMVLQIATWGVIGVTVLGIFIAALMAGYYVYARSVFKRSDVVAYFESK